MARERKAAQLDVAAIVLPIVIWCVAIWAGATRRPEWRLLAAIAVAAMWVGAWGLLTDRNRMIRGLRAAAILIAAAWLHYAGLRIEMVKVPFAGPYVPMGLWSLPVAAVWMWICASLFARAGTIPGVAYGVGIVSWSALFIICMLEPEL